MEYNVMLFRDILYLIIFIHIMYHLCLIYMIVSVYVLHDMFVCLLCIYIYIQTYRGTDHYIRRKFSSETSDNMDRWKAQPGRSSDMEKVRRGKIRDETDQPWRKSDVRRSEMKKIRQDENVGKSRNTMFFRCFVAPEGGKVGSLKRRVRRQLAR